LAVQSFLVAVAGTGAVMRRIKALMGRGGLAPFAVHARLRNHCALSFARIADAVDGRAPSTANGCCRDTL